MVAVMYALIVTSSRFAPETRVRTLEQANEQAIAREAADHSPLTVQERDYQPQAKPQSNRTHRETGRA